MRRCTYCGRENTAAATHCLECGTEICDETTSVNSSGVHAFSQYDFAELSAAEHQPSLVTLLKSRTLAEADLIVSRLAASGIQALIPDECLMQAIGWNLNTFGYVRVQISPQDYQAAVDLLATPKLEGELSTAPNGGPAAGSGNSEVSEGPPSVS